MRINFGLAYGETSLLPIWCTQFVPLNFATGIQLVCGRKCKICALVRLGKLPMFMPLKSNAIERERKREVQSNDFN
jgi:hypothetical protein